jgi:hypothetical protein
MDRVTSTALSSGITVKCFYIYSLNAFKTIIGRRLKFTAEEVPNYLQMCAASSLLLLFITGVNTFPLANRFIHPFLTVELCFIHLIRISGIISVGDRQIAT